MREEKGYETAVFSSGKKRIYLRFPAVIDAALRHAALCYQRKPASYAADIMERFALDSLDDEASLSPLCEQYHLKIGRSANHMPSQIGKPMTVTVSNFCFHQLSLLAMKENVSFSQFRSDVIATEMLRLGFLHE